MKAYLQKLTKNKKVCYNFFMITFLFGLGILFFGYIFYSKYIEKIYSPTDEKTPAHTMYDGVDYVPIKRNRNALIHLLNIAGMGPILGALQGILFGPVAFILIPLGCIFMGAVHDYSMGMLSIRNKGLQITGIIEKYLGKNAFRIFIVIVSVMLLLLSVVFVYTSGDLFVERFFNVDDFSLNNPVVIIVYGVIISYFILATLFPIDKIIGRFYPILAVLLIFGTALILVGFILKGVNLQNIDFHNINVHPKNLPLIPIFFMTVSCGLLSGFHATQATIISRTVENEKDSKIIFYAMMCLESLIAMIWAAAAMDVYSLNLVPDNLIGTANVVNIIADKFVPFNLACFVTLAVIVLPITSGDTALRGLRMTIADSIKLSQKKITNRLLIALPILFVVGISLIWAKLNSDSFFLIWRYFTFFNQLIAIPVLLCASIYLFKLKKNFFVVLLPSLFYIFITSTFILSEKIGFNLDLNISKAAALLITAVFVFYIVKKFKD